MRTVKTITSLKALAQKDEKLSTRPTTRAASAAAGELASPPMMAAAKSFQPDQKAGIVVHRRQRRDQHAGQRADAPRQSECDETGSGCADADKPGTDAVDGRGPQRLAEQREVEQRVETQHEGQGQPDDPKRLACDREVCAPKLNCIREPGCARSFGAEEHQAEPDQRQMHAHRGDLQHEHGSLG